MKPKLFDVLAINIESSKVRIMATKKTEDNADAIISMAVARRGLDEEFFAMEESGKLKDGDNWDQRNET